MLTPSNHKQFNSENKYVVFQRRLCIDQQKDA